VADPINGEPERSARFRPTTFTKVFFRMGRGWEKSRGANAALKSKALEEEGAGWAWANMKVFSLFYNAKPSGGAKKKGTQKNNGERDEDRTVLFRAFVGKMAAKLGRSAGGKDPAINPHRQYINW